MNNPRTKKYIILFSSVFAMIVLLFAGSMIDTYRRQLALECAALIAERDIRPDIDALIHAYPEFDDMTYEFKCRDYNHYYPAWKRFRCIYVDCEIDNPTSQKISSFYTDKYMRNEKVHLRSSSIRFFGMEIGKRTTRWLGPYRYMGFDMYLRPTLDRITDKEIYYSITDTDGTRYKFDDYGSYYTLMVGDHNRMDKKYSDPPAAPKPYVSPSRPSSNNNTYHSYDTTPTKGVYFRGDFYDNPDDLYDDWYDDFDDYEEAESYFD